MARNWKADLKKLVDFLKNIEVQKYAHLRQIKTVERDLPRELLLLKYTIDIIGILLILRIMMKFLRFIGEKNSTLISMTL